MTRPHVVLVLFVWVLFVKLSNAAPFKLRRNSSTDPSALSEKEVQSLRTSASFAADAYCTGLQNGSDVGTDGTVLWKMGDGNHLQMVYVAYSPTLGIVVAHQGG
jgi:hypothetical protein